MHRKKRFQSDKQPTGVKRPVTAKSLLKPFGSKDFVMVGIITAFWLGCKSLSNSGACTRSFRIVCRADVRTGMTALLGQAQKSLRS
ncbi:MAG: hypothetical protein ACI9UN_005083 [Granulosicoccus sp.]|jgi:hypothetical protein